MSPWKVPAILGMVWAQDKRGAISANGVIPWDVPEQLAEVEAVTAGHPVIAGRRTWETLGVVAQTLADRAKYVISRNDSFVAEGAIVVRSLDEALEAISDSGEDEAWIIGGGQIFSEAVGQANVAIVTEINHSYNGDAFAPGLGSEWHLEKTEPTSGWSTAANRTEYRTRTYRK